MPFLPRKIEGAAKNFKQTKLGEEGVLRRGDIEGRDYFIKQWRAHHYDHPAKRGLIYRPEDWRTIVSPFWPKIKYYEAKLVHEAVPELTIPVHAGYDPRLNPRTKSFDFQRGRPTTATRDVQGDIDLRKQRDAMVDELYRVNFDRAMTNQHGVITGFRENYERLCLWACVDRGVARAFGQFLDIRRHIPKDLDCNKGRREEFIRLVDRDYRETIIQRLVHAGIIPVHAEVNYIPTRKIGPNETTGIFLETKVFDYQRLKDAILMARAEKNVANQKYDPEREALRIDQVLDRLNILQKVDECWDNVYYHHPEQEETGAVSFNSRIASALFRVLNNLLQNPKKHFLVAHGLTFEMHRYLDDIRFARSEEEGLRAVKALDRFIQSATEETGEEIDGEEVA